MKTKTIRQTVTFRTDPHDVYEMLMDSRKHAKFSGAGAKISRMIGGKVSTYVGYATGVNIELLPDKKIIQSWRGSDWRNGHFSRATFSLKKVRTGTRLEFIQTGVPDEEYENIKLGWRNFYWNPMKELIEKQSEGKQ